MNALTVLSVVALAACSSGQLLGYPGFYGYPGIYGYPGTYGYPGLLPTTSPVTLKTVDHSPVTLKTVAGAALPYYGHVAPVAPVQTQYHAQDEFGQYSFGFAGGPSSRVENRDAFGNVRGSFNYIDSEGKVQTQHYVADALGFRVSATNLPVAPEAPEAAPLALPGPLPEPVEDTPEVAAAKAAHQMAHDEASAAAAAVPARKKRSVVASPVLGAYSPLRFSYGFSTPLTYRYPSAVVGSPLHYTAAAGLPAFTTYAAAHHVPAVTSYTAAATATPRDAQLLRVVNNPNHAVSYRVD